MRKLHYKHRAITLLRTHVDVSSMQMHNLLRQSHSDAMPLHRFLIRASVKQREKILLVFVRHAEAIVGHTDHSPLASKRNLDNGGVIG